MADFDMAAYLGVFINEVDEQLQTLDEAILALEQDGGNQDTIQRIFRAAHTLKGSSSAMGFEEMKELTHRMENVFDMIRNRQLKVDTHLINVIFECIDSLKAMKEAIVQGEVEHTDPQALIEKLDKLHQGSGTSSTAEQKQDIQTLESEEESPFVHEDSVPVVSFDEYQKDAVLKGIRSGFTVMAIYVQLIEDALMKSIRAFLIHNNLKELGDIVASYPSTDEIENDMNFAGSLVYVYVTDKSKQEIFHVVNQISDIKTVSISLITEENIHTFEGKRIQIVESNDNDKDTEEVVTLGKSDAKVKVNQTVRVDVERLEKLMNLVGELVIDQTRLFEVKNRLNDQYRNNSDVEMLGEVASHVSLVIGELQEGMMKTRMFPIEQLFSRFPRMVRDLSHKAEKELDLIIEGKETELDRTLIEEIGDPIIHLLRNSVDHGIESPEERAQLGKPRKGRLVLKAGHEENHIIITVEDDGRGIDPHKVKMSALKKGLITAEEAEQLTDKEAIFLIFKPGFSTAQQITDISGRGVGMDIVRSHIEKLNGIIDIETKTGAGTLFTLKLPLTLAITRSLLVSLSSRTFAIPLANVLEIVRLDTADIKTIKSQEVGIIRGRVLPLIRLHKKLNIPARKKQNSSRNYVVVVGLADKRVALIVDKTLGNQEIVIKSLGKFIGTPAYIAGATIMGDGNAALILDVNSIVREEGTKALGESMDNTDQDMNRDQEKELVTFTLSSEEYGVEIHHVKDIITVPPITQVMTSSYAVLGIINLRGKLIPIIDLRKKLNLEERELNAKSRIMVIEQQDRLVGIVVDHVTQVLKVKSSSIESVPDNMNGVDAKFVSGVCRTQDRLIIMLDIDFVLKMKELNEVSGS